MSIQENGFSKPHRHKTEQCYMILEGCGIMEIDDEKSTVSAGDTIFIPSNSLHSLYNESQTELKYLSAGSPAFGMKDERKL